MILTELKMHIKNKQTVNLLDLTQHFNIEPEVLREMLTLWIHKGKIRKGKKTNHCGSACVKCHPSSTEIYEWIS